MLKSIWAAVFVGLPLISAVPASASLIDYTITFNAPTGGADIPTPGGTGGTGTLVLNITGDDMNVDLPSPYTLNNGQSFTATIDGIAFTFSTLTGFDISSGHLGNLAGDSPQISTKLGTAYLDLGGNFYQVMDPGQEAYFTGTYSITAIAAATTPLPAALPMFAGGLGLVGYLARRRKRSSGQALAAA
jgi:hypothetical protein